MQKNQYKLVLGFLIILFLFQNNIYAGPPAPAPKTLSTLNALLKTVAKRDSAIEVYLKANKIYDVNVTPDGIYYTIESKGTGINPVAKDYVSVNYTGFLLKGEIVYSRTIGLWQSGLWTIYSTKCALNVRC